MESDILSDCAGRLIQSGIDASIVAKTIAEMRRVYAGETVYIHSVDRQSRDSAIADALTAGSTIKAAAKKAGCHQSTARRVRETWSL